MMWADCPLVWALEEYSVMFRSATLENLGWTFSMGSTKCSISAMVNSLGERGVVAQGHAVPYMGDMLTVRKPKGFTELG